MAFTSSPCVIQPQAADKQFPVRWCSPPSLAGCNPLFPSELPGGDRRPSRDLETGGAHCVRLFKTLSKTQVLNKIFFSLVFSIEIEIVIEIEIEIVIAAHDSICSQMRSFDIT